MTTHCDINLDDLGPEDGELGATIDDSMYPMCCRCYDVAELFPANCAEKPEIQGNLGMYHCPDCGAMVLGGIPHGDLCQPCLDRKHPAFDWHPPLVIPS